MMPDSFNYLRENRFTSTCINLPTTDQLCVIYFTPLLPNSSFIINCIFNPMLLRILIMKSMYQAHITTENISYYVTNSAIICINFLLNDAAAPFIKSDQLLTLFSNHL